MVATWSALQGTSLGHSPTDRAHLCERLERVGFVRGNQIRLYGAEYRLISEPFVVGPNVVFVDAIEKKSGARRRVRIPLTILNMAAGSGNAT